LEVSASIQEADATKLKAGQETAITWSALTDVTATGTVASVDPNSTTTNNVVSYGVVISMTDPPADTRLGQSVDVVVTTGTADNVLYVNAAAITTSGSKHTVTVISNGQQVVKDVEIGLVGDRGTEIKSGLTAGEEVVLKVTTTSSSAATNANGGPGGGNLGGGGPGGGTGPGGGAAVPGGR
jgi:macrolide-specific efflux system membrane fusion protein